MEYCVASGGNLLWVIVWRVWLSFMGYCVARGGNLLWVIVGRLVVIYYGLLCAEWW
jgi:hypothetical protein